VLNMKLELIAKSEVRKLERTIRDEFCKLVKAPV
jgi:hypothetical protein